MPDLEEKLAIVQMDQKLRHTAIHESGHGVCHIRIGIDQLSITIKPRDEIGGSVIANNSVWNAEDAKDQVIAYCAGYAACIAAEYGEEVAIEGCADDFEKAEQIIKDWLLYDINHWQAKAVELMRRPENIRAVDLLATHVLQHITLDADYMDVVVEVADGITTEAEFRQYLDMRREAGDSFA